MNKGVKFPFPEGFLETTVEELKRELMEEYELKEEPKFYAISLHFLIGNQIIKSFSLKIREDAS